MADDADYLLALELQNRWNAEQSDSSDVEEVEFKLPPPSKKPLAIKRSNPRSNLDEEYLNRTQNLVHPQWEILDPTPDVHALFTAFDGKFFQARLKCVTLEWSKRMYSCAGICYSRRNRFGMDVTIRLSEPLLKLRPRKDLVETMLHEMIHAYCFVLNIREGNGGHGPNFKKIMYAINKVAGTNITVYHNFHDEVDIYKQHWWRCNGSCQNRSPFFGYVKRTSNRAPGPNDQWWAAHQESCGGTFMKIKEPEKPKKQNAKKTAKKATPAGTDLRKYFTPGTAATTTISNNENKVPQIPKADGSNINGFSNMNGNLKGPIKSNGGGTMVLNPKNKRTFNTAFPPTSYPEMSTNTSNNKPLQNTSPTTNSPGGNLRKVMTFADLTITSASGGKGQSQGSVGVNFWGQGKVLSSSDTTGKQNIPSNERPEGSINRNHLRDVWAKRFDTQEVKRKNGEATDTKLNEEISTISLSDNENPLRDEAKRRRTANGVASNEDDVVVVSDENAKNKNEWLILDDDVMLREPPAETIAILSDDDDDDDDNGGEGQGERENGMSTRRKPMTTDERQQVIKQEILDETADLLDEDIILIDDEYNDDEELQNLTAVVDLADTSVIDEFFGDDTLLKEFERENDVVPSGSRGIVNPGDDIITCPICHGKMKRSIFGEHLDGCTGIAIKIQPPKFGLSKLSTTTTRPLKPKTKTKTSNRNRAKEILQAAGYTEDDLANIISTSSTEEEDFANSSIEWNTSLTTPQANSTIDVDSPPMDENSKMYRQRNLYKTTVQCPNCGDEVEQFIIEYHLDRCLKRNKPKRSH